MGRGRSIRLRDTRKQAEVPIVPRRKGQIDIYFCGPTVYERIHIGNARPFVIFSVLKRYLQEEGYKTRLVSNLTDVNDKIMRAAEARSVPSSDLAQEMSEAYINDTNALKLGRPDSEPRVSDSIQEIIQVIEDLLEKGHAYTTPDGVFFDVSSHPSYGELSHRREFLSEESSHHKRDARDFALWKREKRGEDQVWPSPWGEGRPGWHIECSAMSQSTLGLNIEIHGGGSDLTFPHHENELAQSKAATGEDLAQVWMHTGMIQMDGEKMAKSVGNIKPLHEVVDEYGRDAVLAWMLSSHWRQPLNYSEAALKQAKERLSSIKHLAPHLTPGGSPLDLQEIEAYFFDALGENFNTAKAFSQIDEWVSKANTMEGPIGDESLRRMLRVFALEDTLDGSAASPVDEQLLEKMINARREKNFQVADRLRDQLLKRGWKVQQSADGAHLIRDE